MRTTSTADPPPAPRRSLLAADAFFASVALHIRHTAGLTGQTARPLPALTGAPAPTGGPGDPAAAEWDAWCPDAELAVSSPLLFPDPPDFASLDRFPHLRPVVAERFPAAVRWARTQRHHAGAAWLPIGNRLMSEIGQRPDRRPRAFELSVTVLPLAGRWTARLNQFTVAVSEAMVASEAATTAWLAPLIEDLA